MSATDFMVGWPAAPLLAAFGLASLVLAVTPGPGVLYIVTRTLAQGRRAGLASVMGVALGNLGNAVGAALGLAALFALSSTAFTLVKAAGAAYLVYLGIRTLRQRTPVASGHLRGTVDARRIFRDGVVVALLNPKTALFFAAFLPQFMSPHGSAMAQSLLLGGMFVGIAAVSDSVYALAAGSISPWLIQAGGGRRAALWGRRFSGSTLIGLGVFTALSSVRH